MFLSPLRRRNPEFLRAAAGLHASGSIPASSYVLDLDAVTANARVMAQAAAGLGLTVFAMTKQTGRNPHFLPRGQRRRHRRQRSSGHAVRAGHQASRPAAWPPRPSRPGGRARGRRGRGHGARVLDRLQRGQGGAGGRRQPVRRAGCRMCCCAFTLPVTPSTWDIRGGFEADDVVAAADFVDGLAGARCAGITTFPALLFSAAEDRVDPTHNLATLPGAAAALAATAGTCR